MTGLLGGRAAAGTGPGAVRLLPQQTGQFFRAERILPGALPLSLEPQVAVLIVLDGHGRW